jgi:hypothetical protein
MRTGFSEALARPTPMTMTMSCPGTTNFLKETVQRLGDGGGQGDLIGDVGEHRRRFGEAGCDGDGYSP